MRNRLIVAIVRELYSEFLRAMIVKHVEQTDSVRDDKIVGLLDLLLDYSPVVQRGGQDG